MSDLIQHTAGALTTLWEATPARELFRLANTGLNFVTARELLAGFAQTELNAILIAIVWLIPWERIVLAIYRAVHRTPAPPARPRLRSPQWASHGWGATARPSSTHTQAPRRPIGTLAGVGVRICPARTPCPASPS